MKNLKYLLFLSCLLLGGCTHEELMQTKDNDSYIASESPSSAVPGVIRVKLTKEVGDNMVMTKSSSRLSIGKAAIDNYLLEIGAADMERVFPYAGKYEERTRKEGLHLWYDIKFDESRPLTRAVSDAKKLPGVEIVEEIYRPVLAPYKMLPANTLTTKSEGGNPFNDPKLSAQWHYHNTGGTPRSVAGADINLFEAWKKETGKPNVIVAIVDEGIDVTHEDLKDNIYVNSAELNGKSGVDDDDNGYIDDIYGYDFLLGQGALRPGRHGTHVAGTVAARNNNGIGVCGVAGGNGEEESGVRLMSCQIVYNGIGSGGSAAAIKYGADNGAVISQNSWTSGLLLPMSEKVAIDYFIKYAGCDNQGNQLPDSPMKGGVAIFAAGNDDYDGKSYPAAYPPVISVSAMAPDYKKANYTNRGDWISIMAPGGDEHYANGQVLSTVPENEYAYLLGTSMACPHVSGIAALVVSKFGGPGFTNEELKRRITTAVLPVDINAQNPDYKGRLGKGYIDAAKALAENLNKKPENIKSVSVKEGYTDLSFTWKAVEDADDGRADTYKLYHATDELNVSNYKTAVQTDIDGYWHKAGEEMTFSMDDLSLNTDYYFAMVAEDRWGLQSDPIFFTGSTKENLPPVLTKTGDDKIRISGTESAEITVNVKEPNGQEWKYALTEDAKGVSIRKEKDNLLITFRAVSAVGKYSVRLTVTDIFNASATLDIPYEIYKNNPPKQVKSFNKPYVPIDKGNYTINLDEYFKDEEGDAIRFSSRSFDPSIAGTSIDGNKLVINPLKPGLTSIELKATDSKEETVGTSFQIQVVAGGLVYTAYPIPASTTLNVRLSNDIKSANIKIRTQTGNVVYEKGINILTEADRMQQLDVSKLSSGTYILNVDADGRSFKQTFIKK